MTDSEARKILLNNPDIQATLKMAEAILTASLALEGEPTGFLSYQEGYDDGFKDGIEDYKSHYGWQSVSYAEPYSDELVLTKAFDGTYAIAKMVKQSPLGDCSQWVLPSGKPLKGVKLWKPIEDD